ncbi:alpha-N-acetylglucosaminidase [candidate division KSB1 bacterium]|nr:MAG: alpha-N-acetylglucosaminidase [candidate division KSB1 bacterium]
MKTKIIISLIIFTILISVVCTCQSYNKNVAPAYDVLSRIVGPENITKFVLSIDATANNSYSVTVDNNKVYVSASNPAGLCRGCYDYLTHACNSIVSWSGNNINIPENLPLYSTRVQSPYKYHYYFNIVTHGYTTPYWDWERWEKEIDWMAVHGINMPLLPGAYEAILYRVFKKLGLKPCEIDKYFTGPAHFPWNKMGNITGWDGPVPSSYYKKQIKLNHQILKRVKELGMHPIVQAFAGFVPSDIQRLYPNEKIRPLSWGGFSKEFQAYILEPGSELFLKIGQMYIEEYEKEFGKQEFYLADSFNEMDVPLSPDPQKALDELSNYGESVYRSIKKGNPDAIWVMQGWTFPYQKKDGKLFWTPERLHALISKVPDDKLLILDLANEYNRLWWKSEPSWKMYSGFFGKQWIYSFIPNMGGKTAFNGRLDLYATMPFEALNYSKKGNLIGFGFAPEGIENNEIIYELLSDVGWSNKPINLDEWIGRYCKNRYGVYTENMKKAFEYFNKSCFGSFTDHPRNAYQFRPNTHRKGTVNKSEDFGKGVQLFLASYDDCRGSELYKVDAIEYTCQYLGLKADELLIRFQETGEKNAALLNKALKIMIEIDRLLESHPNWKLKNWTAFSRKWGDTEKDKKYYEANARRLITTWGGEINDYAAKTWSGLIRDYYIPRWKKYYEAKRNNSEFDMLKWEEEWINSSKISEIEPYINPVKTAIQLFNQYFK